MPDTAGRERQAMRSELVIDNRESLGGSPALHCLFAGVSAYRNLPGDPGQTFDLNPLTCNAWTAYRLFDWVRTHQSEFLWPLGTCRLLLSPTTEELKRHPELRDAGKPCTWDNFQAALKAWNKDCATNRESAALFFFSGHGVHRSKHDGLLLTEEFGDGVGGPLHRAVSAWHIHTGMSPSGTQPKIARTQFYFLDCCRVLPKQFSQEQLHAVPEVFTVRPGEVDYREAPIFYATQSANSAYAWKHETTFFGRALIDALEGVAGKPHNVAAGQWRWQITAFSLYEALQRSLLQFNELEGGDQVCSIGGNVGNPVLKVLKAPPMVEVRMALTPHRASQSSSIYVMDPEEKPIMCLPPPVIPHPYLKQLQAGLYLLRVVRHKRGARRRKKSVIMEAVPPQSDWIVEMGV